MKKILITGAKSYIGTSFEEWVKDDKNLIIDTLDVVGDEWKNSSFNEYDVIFHVAGIAHVSSNPKMEDLYYKVNRDLTVDIASKAKAENVKQFVFMSSIIVYGSGSKIIDKDTIPKPDNFYGLSKLQADQAIHRLQSSDFHVASIRPPMIYGKGSKGNYPRLSRVSRKTPVFPTIKNERSMLHIDNLCEFIRLIILHGESGYFHPQNKEYVNTYQLVKEIAGVYEKNVYGLSIFNFIIVYLRQKNSFLNKLFGTLIYDKELSEYKNYSYCIRTFSESIQLTEEE